MANGMSKAQEPRLQCLPLEIRWQILESLSDVRSLAHAVLTCRALYSAFKAKEADLPTTVLTNCIGHEVLPEAVIVYQCRPPFLSTLVSSLLVSPNELTWEESRRARKYTQEFIWQLRHRKLPFPVKFSMCEAIDLADLHTQAVEPLTQKFIQSCAREPITMPSVDLADSLQARPATRLEKDRIARALYRFELFRKLFGCYGDRIEHMPPSAQLVPHAYNFFKRYAPWEIAQIATIYDFLGREILPAMTDVAEHDVSYGAHALDYSELWNGRIDHPAVQHILTLGLRKIQEIGACDTFKSRVEMLGTATIENYYFFNNAMRFIDFYQASGQGTGLLTGKPFHDDGDTGGRVMHQMAWAPGRYWFNDPVDWLDRRWGHVMWDHERFQDLGVMGPPGPPFGHSWSRAHGSERGIPEDEMEASVKERCRIWSRGGRGYWTKNDSSRVVYPRGVDPFAAAASDAQSPQDANIQNTAASNAPTVTTSSLGFMNEPRAPWYYRLARRIFRRHRRHRHH